MKNRAFTLIELLVVVLIIGVLTAIALPKYQTAVAKSRFAGLMPLAKSVKNAEEAIYMSNGNYTETLTDLSVNVPTGTDVTITPKSDDNESYVRASKTGLNNRLVMYMAKSSRYPNEIHCEAEQENARAKLVCLSYGGSTTAVAGTADSTGYDTYVLEGTGTSAGVLNEYNFTCSEWYGCSDYNADTGVFTYTDGNGAIWQCQEWEDCERYDSNDRLIFRRDGNGDVWQYEYDDNDNVISYKSSLEEMQWTVTYDGNNQTSQINSDGSGWVAGYNGNTRTSQWYCNQMNADGTCGGSYSSGESWSLLTTDINIPGSTFVLPSGTQIDCNSIVNNECYIYDGFEDDNYEWADYSCHISADGTGSCAFM